MSDFQRMALDFAGLFLFALAFVVSVHFRANGVTASFLFFAAAAFFCSLICIAFEAGGYAVASVLARWACILSTAAAAWLFVGVFVMAVM